MKKKTFKQTGLFLIISATLLMSCGGNNKSKTEDSTKSAEIELKEEFPPLKSNTVDAGRLKMHQDSYSIGKKTELTELAKQLQNKDIDIIEITWIWDCSPKYDDMPMKIIYNKRNGILKLIYTQNNVIEEYKNILPECLEEFLKKGEKSFYSLENYCENSEYDFNNREMTIKAVGPKPEQSELNGSVEIVKKYIKDNAHNDSSVKFIEWSKVSPFGEYWIVRCKFKGDNALGGVITENMWFYIQDNQVIQIKTIE